MGALAVIKNDMAKMRAEFRARDNLVLSTLNNLKQSKRRISKVLIKKFNIEVGWLITSPESLKNLDDNLKEDLMYA